MYPPTVKKEETKETSRHVEETKAPKTFTPGIVTILPLTLLLLLVCNVACVIYESIGEFLPSSLQGSVPAAAANGAARMSRQEILVWHHP